jgi:hypothetical protein
VSLRVLLLVDDPPPQALSSRTEARPSLVDRELVMVRASPHRGGSSNLA